MRRVRAAAAAVVLLTLVAVSVGAGRAPATGTALVHAPLAASATAETSTNWAGYAAISPEHPENPMTFTSVTGTWKQAKADCSTSDPQAASSFWVGLGGYDETSDSLEQIGTDADCVDGAPDYWAWYELIPAPPVQIHMTVEPGDTITASVNVTGNVVLFQVKNRTRHTVFTKRVTTQALDLVSAEWVTEAPSSCSRSSCTPVPLTNFGTIAFSRIAMIGNDHPGTLTDPTWKAVPIRLSPQSHRGFFPAREREQTTRNSRAGTTAPTAPSADGRTFSLSWLAKAS